MNQQSGSRNPIVHSQSLKLLAWVAAGIFALMSAAFVGRGLQQLLPSHSATDAKDMRTNWEEWRVVLHRHSPYDGIAILPSPYPPFTFLLNGFLYWPGWSVARLYFALLNLICLAGIAGWGYSIGHRAAAGVAFSLAVAMSLTAFSSIATGLGLGQNSILYVFVLLGALLASERHLNLLTGLLLGIAMSKINIALPFAIPFLFRRDWKVLVIAGVYMLAGTLAIAWWVHSSPVEMIQQWMVAAQKNNGTSYGPGSLLVWYGGVSPNVAARVCAVVFMATAVVVIGLVRTVPMLSLFGLASGFGRLWTYHRVYDNVMLMFLLIALTAVWLRSGSRWVAAAILLLGFTVWFPIHSVDVPAMHVVHVVIWMGSMSVLAIACDPVAAQADK